MIVKIVPEAGDQKELVREAMRLAKFKESNVFAEIKMTIHAFRTVMI